MDDFPSKKRRAADTSCDRDLLPQEEVTLYVMTYNVKEETNFCKKRALMKPVLEKQLERLCSDFYEKMIVVGKRDAGETTSDQGQTSVESTSTEDDVKAGSDMDDDGTDSTVIDDSAESDSVTVDGILDLCTMWSANAKKEVKERIVSHFSDEQQPALVFCQESTSAELILPGFHCLRLSTDCELLVSQKQIQVRWILTTFIYVQIAPRTTGARTNMWARTKTM